MIQRALVAEAIETENDTSLLVGGGEHQPTHKNVDLNFILPIRCAGVKIEQRLRERPTNAWLNQRPTLWQSTNPCHYKQYSAKPTDRSLSELSSERPYTATPQKHVETQSQTLGNM